MDGALTTFPSESSSQSRRSVERFSVDNQETGEYRFFKGILEWGTALLQIQAHIVAVNLASFSISWTYGYVKLVVLTDETILMEM
jgi:hypothetical protein